MVFSYVMRILDSISKNESIEECVFEYTGSQKSKPEADGFGARSFEI